VLALLHSSLEREPSTSEGVRTWFGRSARSLEKSDYRGGCPVATVALEIASESELMRDAACRAIGSWIDLLAASLTAEGLDGDAARQLATRIVEGFEGALLWARLRRSTAEMLQAADHHASVVAAAVA
jgi:TetR/AcrR family transcriptional repressor of lmrAB and yxaGH operons